MATDLDLTIGEGPEVTGPATSLLLAVWQTKSRSRIWTVRGQPTWGSGSARRSDLAPPEAYEWSVPMPPIRIVLLTVADQADLLAFEQTNREFFAKAVGDRGDAFFAEFPRRHQALVDENDQGKSMLFVIRDALDEVVGRVNLADVDTGEPELGYRIAEAAGGRGYATEAVRLAMRAAGAAGVRTVKAMATADNHASHQVLLANGFRRLDSGHPAELDVDGRLLDAMHFEAWLVAPN